jgi:hypothetical protein
MTMSIEVEDPDFGMDFEKSFAKEPTETEIRKYMEENEEFYYAAREELRRRAYGQVPKPFDSWGDYWKSL